MFESWSLGDGFMQPTIGGDSIRVKSLSQFSIPVAFTVDFGDRWRLGGSGAFASSSISLAGGTAVRTSDPSLTGLSDLKLTLTAQVVPDRVLFTFGANLPTGMRELDPGELEALRIVAAPALGLQIPALGTGSGGTAGVVVARQVANWAWAIGASYELRSVYSPYAAAPDLPPADFNPSDAIHLSLGTDGIIGENQMTFSLAADLYTEDKVTLVGDTRSLTARPGPMWTAEWQYNMTTATSWQINLYAIDRYRTSATSADTTISGSSGNYLDVGARGELPLGPQTRFSVGLALRQHSGLTVDRSLASVGATLGALTLGLDRTIGSYALRPFVRAQMGRLSPASGSVNAKGFGAGVALTTAF